MAVDFSGSHKAMDVREHERTYGGFVRVAFVCTVGAVTALALMAVFLV